MRRFFEYYRQFEELAPEEVSAELRARRDEEKARALTEQPALDLTSAAWHEPPHAEVVNAATFALRRAVNAYPDASAEPLREAIADAEGVEPDRVVAGHGAGELMRAACAAVVGGGEVAIAWPGWGPLPRLVHEAGGQPVPVPLRDDGVPDVDALLEAAGERTAAVALATPNDPTGGTVAAGDLERLARGLPEHTWLFLDLALAGFDEEPAPVPAGARVLAFHSFSKAHAMAGFRAGFAIGPAGDLLARLSPVGGVAAPAQAGMLWAVSNAGRAVARRRELAAAERDRLRAALADTPLSFPAGAGPLVWLSSARHSGAEIASHLAARRIFVTPGSAWGDDRHVRIALRGPDATDRLAEALAEL
jgi:histidinol-phosphate/aromatic aminotransferase/cobyric acid decarboxylase-like protein